MLDDFSLSGARIWVAGHRGLVGSALLRRLENQNCTLLTVDKQDCDLRDRDAVAAFYERAKPDIVIAAAAKVGGIKANRDFPADFIFDNLAIAQNIIHEAYKANVRKLVFLGSSCIYPRDAAQPMREDALLTGPLEPTNEAYAIAKIAGIKLCQSYRRQHGCDFISVMPCNLYGPNDRWNDENAHVIPSLISKFHAAKTESRDEVVIWGTGQAQREFLHADDAAAAILHCVKFYNGEEPVNIGAGQEITIGQLAALIRDITGYKGRLVFDPSMLEGSPRKLLDIGKISALGWKPEISLEEGLRRTYRDFIRQRS